VANATCELLGAAIANGNNAIQLAGMQYLQRLCSNTTPDVVFEVLESCVPQLWSMANETEK
jgi:hypothetical protein